MKNQTETNTQNEQIAKNEASREENEDEVEEGKLKKTEPEEQIHTIDVDAYNPSKKEYVSRDITKSRILNLLEEQEKNTVLTFFKCNENEK